MYRRFSSKRLAHHETQDIMALSILSKIHQEQKGKVGTVSKSTTSLVDSVRQTIDGVGSKDGNESEKTENQTTSSSLLRSASSVVASNLPL